MGHYKKQQPPKAVAANGDCTACARWALQPADQKPNRHLR